MELMIQGRLMLVWISISSEGVNAVFRLAVARTLDWLTLIMALVMAIVLFVAVAWDTFTDYGFQHSRWGEPLMQAAPLFLPTIFILQGANFALLSRERVILSEQRLARFAWMRRMGGRTESARTFRWLGLFQLVVGVFMLAFYAWSGMLL
ncbi:MAG: hypothetical protein M3P51_04145 [Chloroflexota bacterium]|nr:hypothetical protein [Chloroflexota bacterium]